MNTSKHPLELDPVWLLQEVFHVGALFVELLRGMHTVSYTACCGVALLLEPSMLQDKCSTRPLIGLWTEELCDYFADTERECATAVLLVIPFGLDVLGSAAALGRFDLTLGNIEPSEGPNLTPND